MTSSVDGLHTVLLRLLADADEPPSTAELCRLLRRHAESAAPGGPAVLETVYRALRTLHRRGQVAHHRPPGRHVRWSLTPSGQHTASRTPAERAAR